MRLRIINTAGKQDDKGFTFFELIAILVIIGVLGGYVGTTSLGIIDAANQKSEMNRLKAHLKFTQSRAISSQLIWGIYFKDTDYALFQYTAGAQYHFFPGEEQDVAIVNEDDCKIPMPSGKTYEGFVWFDKFGRAYQNSSLSPATSQPIAANFSGIPDVTIEANTGYIHDT